MARAAGRPRLTRGVCRAPATTLALSTMDMPPSRYRIVERGRQLVVIDTRPDADVAEVRIESVPPGDALNPAVTRTVEPSTSPVSEDRSGMGLLAQAGGSMGDALVRKAPSGEAEYFDTHRWFDEKGPRRVKLSAAGREQLNVALLTVLGGLGAGAAASVFASPLILLVGLTLFSGKTRTSIRAQITRWIDGLGTTEPR